MPDDEPVGTLRLVEQRCPEGKSLTSQCAGGDSYQTLVMGKSRYRRIAQEVPSASPRAEKRRSRDVSGDDRDLFIRQHAWMHGEPRIDRNRWRQGLGATRQGSAPDSCKPHLGRYYRAAKAAEASAPSKRRRFWTLTLDDSVRTELLQVTPEDCGPFVPERRGARRWMAQSKGFHCRSTLDSFGGGMDSERLSETRSKLRRRSSGYSNGGYCLETLRAEVQR